MNIKLVEYIAQYVKTECSGYYKISKYPICQQETRKKYWSHDESYKFHCESGSITKQLTSTTQKHVHKL